MRVNRLGVVAIGAIAVIGLFVAACGGDDGGGGGSDEAYLKDFCGAFNTFFEAASKDPAKASTAIQSFANSLAKAKPPGDFKTQHDEFVKALGSTGGDISKLASLGNLPAGDKKVEERLAEKAKKVPECQKAGVFN